LILGIWPGHVLHLADYAGSTLRANAIASTAVAPTPNDPARTVAATRQ
jgi:hypothetical protein